MSIAKVQSAKLFSYKDWMAVSLSVKPRAFFQSAIA